MSSLDYNVQKRADGRVYWDDIWQGIEACLQEGKLAEFRSYGAIQERLWSRDRNKEESKNWEDKCSAANIHPKHYEDKLIGKPTNSRIINGVAATASSLRFAWHAHNLIPLVQGTSRVLEVGAGYGAFPEHMFRQFDIDEYHIIDAPVMLALQKYYLGRAGVLDKCHFHSCEDKDYTLPRMDVIISMNSLAEMSKDVVNDYLALFTEVIVPETGLLFLVQRKNVLKNSFQLHTSWEDYEFDPVWELKYLGHLNPQYWVMCYGRKEWSPK